MSIAPDTKKDEEIKANPVQKTVHFAKKSLVGFFTKPAYYIFYGTLTAVIIGLILGNTFDWQLYAFLGFVGALHLFQKPFYDKS